VQEAKLGVVFRGENYVSDQDAKRGQITQARYTAVVDGVEVFRKELDAVLRAERADEVERVIWLGDGSPWIWNTADELCPGASQILDPSHAIEQGMNCAKILLGEGNPCLALWQERLTNAIWAKRDDVVDALISELMDCLPLANRQGCAALNDLIRYDRTHDKRMTYEKFRTAGLPVGSGFVERAHRHVLQVRMKLAGQHWGQVRARRMTTLRAAYRSTRVPLFHQAIRSTHSANLAAASNSSYTPVRPAGSGGL
jgi:hypothetical protein